MRIVMAGTGVFAEPTFETLLAHPNLVVGLFTQPDRDPGHERGSTRQTGKGMKAIAQAHGLPVFQPASINTPEGAAALRALQPDLLVIAAYGQILKESLLAVPRLGCINVHASLLPKYRGAAPINWAIYHGETITGVSVFRLTTGIDTGDILAQESTPIGPDETAGAVEARLAVLGARLAERIVLHMRDGVVPVGTKQDSTQATRAPRLTKEHGAIDWARGAAQVCCQVRAMQPWPTAYTFWHRAGQPPLRLIVTRAHPAPSPTASLVPGQIVAERHDALLVGAGVGTLVEVLEVQPAGKRRMPAGDFLRGRRPLPGDRLGPEHA